MSQELSPIIVVLEGHGAMVQPGDMISSLTPSAPPSYDSVPSFFTPKYENIGIMFTVEEGVCAMREFHEIAPGIAKKVRCCIDAGWPLAHNLVASLRDQTSPRTQCEYGSRNDFGCPELGDKKGNTGRFREGEMYSTNDFAAVPNLYIIKEGGTGDTSRWPTSLYFDSGKGIMPQRINLFYNPSRDVQSLRYGVGGYQPVAAYSDAVNTLEEIVNVIGRIRAENRQETRPVIVVSHLCRPAPPQPEPALANHLAYLRQKEDRKNAEKQRAMLAAKVLTADDQRRPEGVLVDRTMTDEQIADSLSAPIGGKRKFTRRKRRKSKRKPRRLQKKIKKSTRKPKK